MRESLGDGYVEALWAAYPKMPQSADLVMFWWEKAAMLARTWDAKKGKGARRFGLITTNSLRQVFNRRVLEPHLADKKKPLSLLFAIPDHPWVDASDGAAVRIAMTVGVAGSRDGKLLPLKEEREAPDEAEGRLVSFAEKEGKLAANLQIGADLAKVRPLEANERIASPGVKLHGAGFIVTPGKGVDLGLGTVDGLEGHILPYLNGRDVAQVSRNVMVIDLYPLSQKEVMARFPSVYQHVFDNVKPERDQNREPFRRNNWHWFGRTHEMYRAFTRDIDRFIVTPETAKHRFFRFVDRGTRADNMLIAIGLDDAAYLSVLSSRVHVTWALAAGGRLGMGNDPRYNKSRCFDPFPFPDSNEAQRARMRDLGEQLDAHRKTRQAAHPKLTDVQRARKTAGR
jgi:hypothetical protein